MVELADEIDFDVRIGEGTSVRARKFAEPTGKRRQVGIFGRPHPDETISGDHACFVRSNVALLVAVADGLGHGPLAREASELAIETVREHENAALWTIVGAVHEALAHTRGTVLATSRFVSEGRIETARVGNMSVHVHGPTIARRLSGPSFVLGAPGQIRRVAVASAVCMTCQRTVPTIRSMSSRGKSSSGTCIRSHAFGQTNHR